MTDQKSAGTAAMVHSPPGYRVITVEEAEKRFRVSDDIGYPYADFADEQEIRLYEGGLHVAGHLGPEGDDDWVPYNTIVDGDLTVDGDLDWWDHSGGNFLVVTGSLRARNVILAGCPNVAVRGDLEVTGGICCSYGDDGGLLTVCGSTRAQLLVSMLYFNLVLAEQPQALFVSSRYRSNCPVDFDDDELHTLLLPELLDDHGEADAEEIEQALREGRQVLRAGVRPSHLAALEELDALLDRVEEVTELDLSARRLRHFPQQLLAFPRLRVLSLADNPDLGRLDPRIGELTALEELDVSGTGLTELPESVGRLPNLRELDISDNDFTTSTGLPDCLGDLGRLEALRASHLTCHLPESLARLRSLRELDLSRYRQGRYLSDTPVDLPDVVTRMPGLRSLDLSGTRLDSVPDTLLNLTELEELNLNGSLSAQVYRLPELARLPRLRVLRLSGHTPSTDQRPPSRDLLAGIWDITTLEHLEIDRWGQEVFEGNKVRKPLRALPDCAFARTPNLRHVDLSFNELTTLPEPFYALRHLEFVDLRYSRLDQPTRERLRGTFPHVRIDLRDTGTRGTDVDDANWQAVHTLVKDGGAKLRAQDHQQAATAFEEAIALCVPGSRYSDYDQLYAHYGLVDALGHLADHAPERDRPAMAVKLIRYAEQALALIPGTIWHLTDEGAFQEEVKRRTGNALAWHLLHSGEPERALTAVEQALTVASAPEYDFIRDTQVRVLLALGRTEDAYRVADRVLTRDPSFDDLTDIAALPEFQSWRREQRTHRALGGGR
ncbi:leucine-rich repeat domain-containing protein [Streptomyces sp. TRM68416]|uniref:leucine-rich repeat domain-containing protein n=1 Tax=Streptomyces sp. TRM68416 TaxID=2758412 RepID=UPI001661ED97|nr:leucine-rich repeat domain-containing protein [Streptomyces sp. TRM68416]MBD0841517.1 leucine-rich repeat domain-containing protein [Streptomyces sp. TRM68416]